MFTKGKRWLCQHASKFELLFVKLCSKLDMSPKVYVQLRMWDIYFLSFEHGELDGKYSHCLTLAYMLAVLLHVMFCIIWSTVFTIMVPCSYVWMLPMSGKWMVVSGLKVTCWAALKSLKVSGKSFLAKAYWRVQLILLAFKGYTGCFVINMWWWCAVLMLYLSCSLSEESWW